MSSFSSSSASSKPRYHGNITIEMIDDYFNPFLNLKKEKVSKVKFVPGPTTNGQGLPMDPRSRNIVQKTRATNDINNFDYVIQNKRQYEREIKEERDSIANRTFERPAEFAPLHDTSAASHAGTRSIVGSGMSQIESVTTMNMSMSRKQAMMKHAVGLTKMRHDEDADCIDENNNFGMGDMQKQIEEARRLYETDKEVQKQRKLDELCETYDFKPKIDVKLPITEKRDRLLNFLDCYPYSIIQGNTGNLLNLLSLLSFEPFLFAKMSHREILRKF